MPETALPLIGARGGKTSQSLKFRTLLFNHVVKIIVKFRETKSSYFFVQIRYTQKNTFRVRISCMPSPLEFIRTVKLELKQVKWPSHEAALKMTILVIITSLAVAVYSGGLDYLFTSLLTQTINR